MVLFSAAKSNSEVYALGGLLKEPTLFVRRHENEEVYLEHIQDFFVVVRTSQSHSFEVFLVNENDAFGFLSQQEQQHRTKGLIDYCFEAKKVVPLTPAPSTDDGSFIQDDFRIFDMDVLRVCEEEESKE